MGFDEATWTALAAVLTALGAAWTWYAWRHRGLGPGLRGAGLTLLPPAAWATGSLEMLAEITGSVADWASDLVFDPRTWIGIVLAGLAVVLFVVGGVLANRSRPAARNEQPRPATGRGERTELPPDSPRPTAPVDDDLADIEEILRRRGIE